MSVVLNSRASALPCTHAANVWNSSSGSCLIAAKSNRSTPSSMGITAMDFRTVSASSRILDVKFVWVHKATFVSCSVVHSSSWLRAVSLMMPKPIGNASQHLRKPFQSLHVALCWIFVWITFGKLSVSGQFAMRLLSCFHQSFGRIQQRACASSLVQWMAAKGRSSPSAVSPYRRNMQQTSRTTSQPICRWPMIHSKSDCASSKMLGSVRHCCQRSWS